MVEVKSDGVLSRKKINRRQLLKSSGKWINFLRRISMVTDFVFAIDNLECNLSLVLFKETFSCCLLEHLTIEN